MTVLPYFCGKKTIFSILFIYIYIDLTMVNLVQALENFDVNFFYVQSLSGGEESRDIFSW